MAATATTLRSQPARLEEEDRLRADLYRLLARALLAPPDAALLRAFAELKGDTSPMGRAFAALSRVAMRTAEPQARDEHDALFVGLGTRGEVLPYASYYLTGFLHEKPLAALREDMERRGIEREGGVSEPEDHAGAVCEMMAGLIDGAYGAPAALPEQRAFFERHLGPWIAHFFEDLEGATTSRLYQPIGQIGRLFLAIERDAFSMEG